MRGRHLPRPGGDRGDVAGGGEPAQELAGRLVKLQPYDLRELGGELPIAGPIVKRNEPQRWDGNGGDLRA